MSAREAIEPSPEHHLKPLSDEGAFTASLPNLPGWAPELVLPQELEKEELERHLLAHELQIARQIQQSLLPKTLPLLPGFGLAAFCRSARQVGGDYYEVLPLAKDCLLLVVADVMGKGVPAALFAATLRTLVRTISEMTKHPSELLSRMNRLMFEELSTVDMFIPVQAAVADPRHRRLVVANAGHCPLLITDGEGSTKAISPEGVPLGILADASFAEETEPLEPSSCALLYTDGLTEARNAQGEPFGQVRLQNWLGATARQHRTADELKQSFLSELSQFQSLAAPQDDQTFLLLAGESYQPDASR